MIVEHLTPPHKTLAELNFTANASNKHPEKLGKNELWRYFKTPQNDKIPFKRNQFFNYLLYEAGHFQLYTNAVEILSINVESWSTIRLPYWQRMYDILCADYEPLWNYNRFDEDSENTEHNANDNGTEANKVAGYDSGELVENYDTDTDVKEHSEDERERNTHSYGNIGVMSTQDLVKQEIEVCRISIYDIILDDFKDKFCIQIY